MDKKEAFLALTENQTIRSGIDLLMSGSLPENEARPLAQAIWRELLPELPTGRRFAPESFFRQASDKMAWKLMIPGYKNEKLEAWFCQQIAAGRHLKKQVFLPAYYPPVPSARKF